MCITVSVWFRYMGGYIKLNCYNAVQLNGERTFMRAKIEVLTEGKTFHFVKTIIRTKERSFCTTIEWNSKTRNMHSHTQTFHGDRISKTSTLDVRFFPIQIQSHFFCIIAFRFTRKRIWWIIDIFICRPRLNNVIFVLLAFVMVVVVVGRVVMLVGSCCCYSCYFIIYWFMSQIF